MNPITVIVDVLLFLLDLYRGLKVTGSVEEGFVAKYKDDAESGVWHPVRKKAIEMARAKRRLKKPA